MAMTIPEDQASLIVLELMSGMVTKVLEPLLTWIEDPEEREWLAERAGLGIAEGCYSAIQTISGYQEMKASGMTFEGVKAYIHASDVAN